MNKDEALKMAIGKLVLEKMTSGNDVPVSRCTITNVEIHALSKEALEQPAQEPVAFQWLESNNFIKEKTDADTDKWRPLYTHPHQWQGLTDDDIHNIADHSFPFPSEMFDEIFAFARAIEQALRIKNESR